MWAGSGCVYERSERKTNHSPPTLGAKRPTATHRAGAARATARGTGRERKRLGPLSGGPGAGRQWRAAPGRAPAGPPARSRAPPATQTHTHAHTHTPNGRTFYSGTSPSGGMVPPFFHGGVCSAPGPARQANEPQGERAEARGHKTAEKASEPEGRQQRADNGRECRLRGAKLGGATRPLPLPSQRREPPAHRNRARKGA